MLTGAPLPPAWDHLQDRLKERLRDSVRTAIKLRAPKTPDELWRLLGYRMGLWFARRPLCDDHDAPFDFISTAYFEGHDRIFGMAAKGTGKTQQFALLHQLNSETKPGCWTAHVGSIEAQARRCWDYVDQQLRADGVIGRDAPQALHDIQIPGQPQRSRIVWRNGSRLEILAGTLGQVSGPHPNVGAMDEFELGDWEVWAHMSKNLSASDTKAAQMILGSTRFKQRGPVQRILDTPGLFKIIRWCIYDAMAKCPLDCDNVPGWGQCPLWSRMERQADGSQVEIPMCAGRAHHAEGHLSFAEVLMAFLLSDFDSWGTLMELRKPGRAGTYFPEFDDTVGGLHVRAEYEYVPGRPVYLGYDDGYHPNPCALGAWQEREDGVLYQFDEIYGTRILTRELATDLADKPWLEDVDLGWPDPSAKKAIAELREWCLARLGRPVMAWTTDTNRIQGWKAVRRRLQNPGGRPTLGFHPRCTNTIRDLAGLVGERDTEDCEKIDDHGADQARYLVHNYDLWKGYAAIVDGEARPALGNDRAMDSARLARIEGLVRERVDKLISLGYRPTDLRRIEQQYAGQRSEYAIALGGLITELMQMTAGRLERAGLRRPVRSEDELDR